MLVLLAITGSVALTPTAADVPAVAQVRGPDMAILKLGDASVVAAGDRFGYFLIIVNQGDQDATGYSSPIPFPPG